MKYRSQNPFLPSYEYVPDSEPYVFDGRVYIYGSHDAYGVQRLCFNDYVSWSAPIDDLSDWRYEGEMFNRAEDPTYEAGKSFLHAPDVTKGEDGRYYLYYPMGGLGVAVSDTPQGPYHFLGRVKHADGQEYGSLRGDPMIDDPAVLCEDGHVYLYTGYATRRPQNMERLDSLGRKYVGAYCTELESDMITVKGEARLVVPGANFADGTSFKENEFFEASGIRKIGEKYYFVYSSHRLHDLCYAVSDYPDRDFRYGGIIISNADIGLSDNPRAFVGNNHGNIVKIGEDWYVFYHRQTGKGGARQACAEKIKINPDGSIDQVKITSQGLFGKPLPTRERYGAYIACNIFETEKESTDSSLCYKQEGEDGEECAQYIEGMTSGSTVGYKYFDFDGSEESITLTYKCDTSASFELRADNENGEVCANVNLTPSTEWTSTTAKVQISRGIHAIYLTYRGEGTASLLEFEMN